MGDLFTLVEDQKKPWLNIVCNSIKLTGNDNSEGSPYFKNSVKSPGDVVISGTAPLPIAATWLNGTPQFTPGFLKVGSVIELVIDGTIQTAVAGRTLNINTPFGTFPVVIAPIVGAPAPLSVTFRHTVLVPGAGGFVRTTFLAIRNLLLEGQSSVTVPANTDVVYNPTANWSTAEVTNLFTSIAATISVAQ